MPVVNTIRSHLDALIAAASLQQGENSALRGDFHPQIKTATDGLNAQGVCRDSSGVLMDLIIGLCLASGNYSQCLMGAQRKHVVDILRLATFPTSLGTMRSTAPRCPALQADELVHV